MLPSVRIACSQEGAATGQQPPFRQDQEQPEAFSSWEGSSEEVQQVFTQLCTGTHRGQVLCGAQHGVVGAAHPRAKALEQAVHHVAAAGDVLRFRAGGSGANKLVHGVTHAA